MNQFSRRKIDNTQSVSELLKKARFDLKLSLEEAGKKTDISPDYLLALESGEYFKIPGQVYIKGFLKKYARLLGLSVDKIMQLYEQERQWQKNLFETNKIKPSQKTYLTVPLIRKLVIIIIFFIVVGYLFVSAVQANQPPKLKIISPKEDLVTPSEQIAVRGETDQDAAVFINDQPVFCQQGVFEEKIELKDGLNMIKISVIGEHNKERTIMRQVIKTNQ